MQQGLIAKFGQHALAATGVEALMRNAVDAIVEALMLISAVSCDSIRTVRSASKRARLGAGWVGRKFGEAGRGTQIAYLIERVSR